MLSGSDSSDSLLGSGSKKDRFRYTSAKFVEIKRERKTRMSIRKEEEERAMREREKSL